MSFMEPQIEYGHWLLVETRTSGYTLPESLFPGEDIIGIAGNDDRWDLLKDYVDTSGIVAVDTATGFGARLSAPGYLDCTDWTFFDTEKEAEEYLADLMGDDEDEASNPHKEEPQYCDNCGDVLVGTNFVVYTHLPFDVDSANEGESAILCFECDEKLTRGNE